MNSGLGIITVKKVDLVLINKGFPGPITFKPLNCLVYGLKNLLNNFHRKIPHL